MAATTEKNLLSLNADCLLEIFKYLDSDDIIAMSQVCSSFDAVIEKRLKANFEFRPNCFECLDSMVIFMSKFGSNIKYLRMHEPPQFNGRVICRNHFEQLVAMYLQHFSAKLASLDILFDSRDGSSLEVSWDLSRAVQLKIRVASIVGDDDFVVNKINSLLENTQRLEYLEIGPFFSELNLGKLNLEKIAGLKRFFLNDCNITIEDPAFQRALKMIGPQLTHFAANGVNLLNPRNIGGYTVGPNCSCETMATWTETLAKIAPNLINLALTVEDLCFCGLR